MTPIHNELWECRNCFYIGALDTHGRCPRCGSDAVITQELLRYTPKTESTYRHGVPDRDGAVRMVASERKTDLVHSGSHPNISSFEAQVNPNDEQRGWSPSRVKRGQEDGRAYPVQLVRPGVNNRCPTSPVFDWTNLAPLSKAHMGLCGDSSPAPLFTKFAGNAVTSLPRRSSHISPLAGERTGSAAAGFTPSQHEGAAFQV